MNYLKIYCKLIRKAETRDKIEGYTENHHVFPKSIYGNNNRIVPLTAREHYIAHMLLEKICIKRYGLNHIKTCKMMWAHLAMKSGYTCPTKKCHYINSYIYEKCRIRYSIYISDNHWNRKLTEEQIKVIYWYIKKRNQFKQITYENLALYFNVSSSCIFGIDKRKTWKHLELDENYILPERYLYVPLEIALLRKKLKK